MKLSLLKTRFIGYLISFSIISWFLFNFLLTRQNSIMYQYFIEKPTSYNLERAERLASSIYQSFKKEVPSSKMEDIRTFINKYNDIPFLSVNFIYPDDNGMMHSILKDTKEIDILSAEYVYPIKYKDYEIGTLLIYDINKEYKKGLEEYSHSMNVTRVSFAFLLLLLLSVILFREYNTLIEHQKRMAEYQAVHDGLTGLFTQKYFKRNLEKEINRSQRYKSPLSLIMCDVDKFKNFNDTHGHLAGDKVLQAVAHIFAANVRTFDIVARYGGEEFAILLIESGFKKSETSEERLKALTDQTVEIANRIRTEIEQTQVEIEDKKLKVTISMGVSNYNGVANYKPEYLISAADRALYESKENGRNMVTFFDHKKKEFRKAS